MHDPRDIDHQTDQLSNDDDLYWLCPEKDHEANMEKQGISR